MVHWEIHACLPSPEFPWKAFCYGLEGHWRTNVRNAFSQRKPGARQAGLSAHQSEDFHLDKKLRNYNLKSKEKINISINYYYINYELT